MSAEEKLKVKLITLLNVASQRNPRKRKAGEEDWHEIARCAKALPKVSNGSDGEHVLNGAVPSTTPSQVDEKDAAQSVMMAEVEDNEDSANSQDPFKLHFATESTLLSPNTLASVQNGDWKSNRGQHPIFGGITRSRPATASEAAALKPALAPKIAQKFVDYAKRSRQPALPAEILDLIGTYQDLLYNHMALSRHDVFRAVLSAHAMNHVNKTRARILKNNEWLAAHSSSKANSKAGKPSNENEPDERDVRDQGFTRPKIIILVPFRQSALDWMEHIKAFSLATQVENNARFQTDFSLPEGAIDKLATDEKDADGLSKYPSDHRHNFKGNIDDTFRVGVKVTRKSLKLYSEFYQSDIILASPLGLRSTIDKEKSADFLSSIEIVIVDQPDVMQMQNWEHVQFLFEQMNQIPRKAHGTDFSRVKPWYLDGHAKHLRQTICLTSQESPEIRHLFSQELANVSGRIHLQTSPTGVLSRVKPGVKQTFARFEVNSLKAIDDTRFAHFTEKMLPALRQSAVASSHTLIFVPSYFDFVRVRAHLKTLGDLSFAMLSEYSSNSEISRTRANFFNGRVSYLLVTERFHFFRRYKIRGAQTIVFYAPPEHASFYAEYLEYPFLTRAMEAKDGHAKLEPSEVTCQVAFSKYDFLAMERIVGTENAQRMCLSEEGERFSFI